MVFIHERDPTFPSSRIQPRFTTNSASGLRPPRAERQPNLPSLRRRYAHHLRRYADLPPRHVHSHALQRKLLELPAHEYRADCLEVGVAVLRRYGAAYAGCMELLEGVSDAEGALEAHEEGR